MSRLTLGVAGLGFLLVMSGCASSELHYSPAVPAYELGPGRLLPITEVQFKDYSGGVHYSGTTLVLKKPFFETFKEAVTQQMSSLKVPLSPREGSALEVRLTQAGLMRGAGFMADVAATVTYELVVSSQGRALCRREVTGWVSLSERLASTPAAQALEKALSKSVNNLGPAISASCLFEPAPVTTSTRTVSVTTVAQEKKATISSVPFSELDVAPSSMTLTDGKLLAVMIGVEDYRNDLPSARFATRDVRAVQRYATALLGLSPQRSLVLTNEHATMADLNKAINGWLPNQVAPQDKILLYFSGHGAADPVTKAGYLMPYDGDPNYLEQTALPLKRLYASLGRLPAQVTVIIDSCFSGGGERSVGIPGARPLVIEELSTLPANVTVISAAAAGQISRTDLKKGYGLFTYYFLKSWKANGADFRTAFESAKSEVEQVARSEYGSDQSPQWRRGR